MLNSDAKESVLSTLASDAFVAVNKKILRALEGNASDALLLAELIAHYRYVISSEDKASTDNLFEAVPVSLKRIEKTLGMSPYRQKMSIDRLQSKNLLYAYLRGMPARRYVVIDFNAIQLLLEQEDAKNKKDLDSRASFYAELNHGLFSFMNNSFQGKPSGFGNIKYPLSDAMLLISYSLKEVNTQRIPEWTPQAVGVLKHVVEHPSLRIDSGVDMSRLQDTLSSEYINPEATTETQLVFELAKYWKRVLPRDPNYKTSAFLEAIKEIEQ